MRVESRGFGQYAIKSTYSPALRAACKTTLGMSWHPTSRVWCGDATAVSTVCALLRSQGIRLDSSALDAPPTEDVIPRFDEWALNFANAAVLRDYQKDAVSFLLHRKRVILADEMGLGKTIVAITAARALKSRVFVACPSFVRGVWRSELQKWWPAAKVAFLSGRDANMTDEIVSADVVVSHYELLPSWAPELRGLGFRVCIFDEGHALMSAESKRSVAARLVSSGGACEFVWVLTGTPLTNRPKDLWNVVDTLNPGVLGSFFQYGVRYCNGHQRQVTPTKHAWDFSGSSNEEELGKRIAPMMLRRLKSDVALQLPPKTRQVLRLEVPLTMPVGELSRAELRRYLDLASDKKLPEAIALLREHVSQGARVVAFCHRKSTCDAIVDALRADGAAAYAIHGGISVMQRERLLAQVRAEEGGALLATTIDLSSSGVDFTFASVGCFVELVWEPHKLLQAEARLHRPGAASHVFIQYLLGKGGVDEIMCDVVLSKLDTFEKVVGPSGAGMRASFGQTEDEILADLAASIEAAKTPTKKKTRTQRVRGQ